MSLTIVPKSAEGQSITHCLSSALHMDSSSASVYIVTDR